MRPRCAAGPDLTENGAQGGSPPVPSLTACARRAAPESSFQMAIQWFPGHMHTTRKAIAERLPDIDVVIELLDARLHGSSANSLLAEMTRGKPALKVLNKQDLADPDLTGQWLAHYRAQPGTRAIGLDASVAGPA